MKFVGLIKLASLISVNLLLKVIIYYLIKKILKNSKLVLTLKIFSFFKYSKKSKLELLIFYFIKIK